MNTKRIEVVVSESGEIKIEAVNFKGADCEKATAFLEKALGTVQSTKRKPDYFQPNTQPKQATR